jgi:hypothetical protein
MTSERTVEFEVRNVKRARDRDELPYVEVVLRTQDFEAGDIIDKYHKIIYPLKARVVDYFPDEEVPARMREIFR